MKTIMGFSANHFKVFLMAVVMSTAFFAHETIIPTSTEEQEARMAWKKEKKQRTIDLENLIEAAKGTEQYNKFISSSDKTDLAYSKLTSIKKETRFLNFKNFRLFVGEFDWAFGLFLFSIISLIRSTFRKGANKESIKTEFLFHAPFIFVSIFYMNWCFMMKDYKNVYYVLANIGCLIIMLIATYRFINYQKKIIKKQGKKSILHLFGLVSDIRVNHYAKMSLFAENTIPEEIIDSDRKVLDEKIEKTINSVVNDVGVGTSLNLK